MESPGVLAWATITTCHRLTDLNNRHLFPTVQDSQTQEAQIWLLRVHGSWKPVANQGILSQEVAWASAWGPPFPQSLHHPRRRQTGVNHQPEIYCRLFCVGWYARCWGATWWASTLAALRLFPARGHVQSDTSPSHRRCRDKEDRRCRERGDRAGCWVQSGSEQLPFRNWAHFKVVLRGRAWKTWALGSNRAGSNATTSWFCVIFGLFSSCGP